MLWPLQLTSGCEAWWGLTAMPTHYSSQCLPSPLAWHASLAPAWLHKLSTLATFVIEIPLTFLFFAPTAALRKLTFYCQVCCTSREITKTTVTGLTDGADHGDG